MAKENTKEEFKKYLEPDFPLLEAFRELAPGSFKHSQNVANMCELIAMDLSLRADLMKVVGLYHDIGKMYNPKMFSENQEDENPHDKLEPYVSYHLISRHIGDSVLILLNNDFPTELIKIISQHHGNTIMRYFYDKSKSQIEDLYRYKGKQPESDEAAILMIVDSVEATARSLSSNGKMDEPINRKNLVDNTINRLTDDDQLDNIKMGVLKVIRKVLYKELDSMYHRRVSYPDDEETIGEKKDVDKENKKDDMSGS